MVNYNSDNAIQDVQDEMYREEERRPGGIWSQLDPRTRMLIAGGVGVLLILTLTERILVRDALLYGAIGIIVLYLMKSGDSSRSELTWIECMVRVSDLLHFLQRHPIGGFQQVPRGEVRVYPIGRKQWYEGRPYKRSYKVELYSSEEDISENYFVEVDVFTGDIITFKYAPEGVYGDETKDIKLMPTYDMMINRRKDSYLGKRQTNM